MTAPRRLEQDLPALLADLYMAGTPDYRDDLVLAIARTSQRPAWTFPERWLPMDIATTRVPTARFPIRAIGVLALIGLLIAATIAVYIGAQPRVPEPFGPAVTGLHVYTRGGDVLTRDGFDGAEVAIIAGATADLAIAPSPDGSRLLTLREADEGHDLYVSSIDGTGPVRIGGPFLQLGRIEWSPDGSTIAVADGSTITSVIHLVNADGTGSRQLDLGIPADEPSWRPPDGRQLSFRGWVDGNWALFLVDADGSSEPRLLDVDRDLLEAPYELLDIAWSPRGDRIAYHRLVLTPGEGNGNGFRISVATVDPTGALVDEETFTFLETSDDEFHPVWTSDGQHLVFLRRDGAIDTIAMAEPTADVTATEFSVTAIGDFGGLGFTLTPDGEQIAVHDWDAGADHVIDIESGVVTLLDEPTEDGYAFQRVAP